jgi:hypothetical protein
VAVNGRSPYASRLPRPRRPFSLALFSRSATTERLHVSVGFLANADRQGFGLRAVVACLFELGPQRANAREALNEIAVRSWLVAQARQYNVRLNRSDQEL